MPTFQLETTGMFPTTRRRGPKATAPPTALTGGSVLCSSGAWAPAATSWPDRGPAGCRGWLA